MLWATVWDPMYKFSDSIVIIDANPELDPSSSSSYQSERDQHTSSAASTPSPVEPLRSPRDFNDRNLGTTPRLTKRRKLLHPFSTPSPPSLHPPNLAAYARETISAVGNRRHVLGIYIQGTQLYYPNICREQGETWIRIIF